jgi:hypothetical protein
MTETLTESFCERCGTRYTFESARPRTRMKGVKVLSRGLKNFVMSDETSMDEAMAAARSETDRELTSHQLDAFHKTFNFCMSCRQYTCPNCWNEAEARCLSCAPHLGHEILPAPFPDMAAGGFPLADGTGANGLNGSNPVAHPVELVGAAEIAAARQSDEVDVAARLAALTAPAVTTPEEAAIVEVEAPAPEVAAEAAFPAVAEIATEPDAAAETVAAGEFEAAQPLAPDDAVEPIEADEQPATPSWLAALAAARAVDAATDDGPATPAAARGIDEKAASQTSSLLQRFRPGQNLDAELAAYERERTVAEVAAAATVGAVAGEPDVAASAEPEVESTPEVETAPKVETAPEVAAAAATPVVDDIVAQPVWQMVAPDPGADAPLEPPTLPAAASAAAPTAEPQWPTRPQWTGGAPSTGLPFLGRPAAPEGGLEALWAESNREVVATPANPGRTAGVVQPCVSCGLSLSATARFCRRCGTPQGG